MDFATNEDPLQKRLYLAPYDSTSQYEYIQLFESDVEDYYLHRRLPSSFYKPYIFVGLEQSDDPEAELLKYTQRIEEQGM